MISRIRDKFAGAGAWWLLAPVMLLSMCGVYAGLADLDYYWQADLGSDVLAGLQYGGRACVAGRRAWGVFEP